MATTYTNKIIFQDGIYVNGETPLDDRLVLNSFSDLYITKGSGSSCILYQRAYKGMQITIMNDGDPKELILRDVTPYQKANAVTVNASNYEDYWVLMGADITERIDGLETTLKNADASIIAAYKAADKALTDKLNSDVSTLNATIKSKDDAINEKVDDLETELKADDASIIAAYKNADSNITSAYQAADSQLSGRITTEVNNLNTKITNTTNALNTSIGKIQTEFSQYTAANDASMSAFAAKVEKDQDDFEKEIKSDVSTSIDSLKNDVSTSIAGIKNDVSTSINAMNDTLDAMDATLTAMDATLDVIDASYGGLYGTIMNVDAAANEIMIDLNARMIEVEEDQTKLNTTNEEFRDALDSSMVSVYNRVYEQELVITQAFNNLDARLKALETQ